MRVSILKKILIIINSLLLFGCNQKYGSVDIVMSKIQPTDSTSFLLHKLSLENSDSTFYKIPRPLSFRFKDTIKIKEISIGTYSLQYTDIIGNKISRKVKVGENLNIIKILTDSINTESIKHEIPFVNLKNNNHYTIGMKGGCVASYYGNYKVSLEDNKYYFESIGQKKRALNQDDINAIKKFEAELFAIDGKIICSSTGSKTFTITTNVTKIIRDNTCNWNGWENLFSSLNSKSYYY